MTSLAGGHILVEDFGSFNLCDQLIQFEEQFFAGLRIAYHLEPVDQHFFIHDDKSDAMNSWSLSGRA